MQLRLQFLLLVYLFFTLLPAQDGIIGTGFANGWNYPADVVAMQPSLGGSFIYTDTAAAVGDNFFRFTRSDNGNQYGPFDCVDTEWTDQDGVSYNDMGVCNVTGEFFIDAPNTTDNYVFKTRFQDNDDFLFFRIQGPVFDFLPGQTVQDPMKDGNDKVASNTPVTVSTIANPSPGQGIFLRYTTDGFATSTVIQMLDFFGINIYDGIIPGQPDGTTVTYYLFSSGDGINGPMADGSDADYKTINAENNGGSNFFYITDGTLPVVYTKFEAQRKVDGVQLSWATSTERNADHFELQRSMDNGRSWQICGQVAALNTQRGADYQYLDHDAPSTQLQYRLRQVDADGTAYFSNIIRVNAQEASIDITLFPQPASDRIFINSRLDSYDNSKLELLDLNGHLLKTAQLNGSRYMLNIENVPQGVYLVRFWQGTTLIGQQRIIKQ